jgi:hypothetical protein
VVPLGGEEYEWVLQVCEVLGSEGMCVLFLQRASGILLSGSLVSQGQAWGIRLSNASLDTILRKGSNGPVGEGLPLKEGELPAIYPVRV